MMNALWKIAGSRSRCLPRINCRFLQTTSTNRFADPHEPEYLELLKPQIPVYELINIQIKGYDFTTLEHYAQYVHNIVNKFNIKVVNAWATPNQSLNVSTFKPHSTSVLSSYQIKIYERNVQVENLPAVTTPLLIEMIQNALPEGVTLSLIPHNQEIEDDLYIPDLELESLRKQLDEIENPFVHGKKK